MSDSGEAAEQAVRMTIEGAQVALKLTGAAAERITVMIYTIMKDRQNTMGKTRLAAMLKSGKEMTVFTINENDLAAFAEEAKRYGVPYCALKEKKGEGNGIIDVLVYKDDASKINRIVERLGLATVAVTEKTGDEAAGAQEQAERPGNATEKEGKEQAEQSRGQPAAEERETAESKELAHSGNPTAAETESPHRSGHTSRSKGTSGKGFSESSQTLKKSVRKDIAELRAKREFEQYNEPFKEGRKREYEKSKAVGKTKNTPTPKGHRPQTK